MTSKQTIDQLRVYESRNVTFLDPDGSWPIVWDRARGVTVWDVDGHRYLDLTAAFGVAAAGHANPHVVRAGQQQMARLLHAMGDVHPHPLKGVLARELSRWTFERWSRPRSRISLRRKSPEGKTIFGNSGFEAVEAALKTAMLATGRRGIIAFDGAYHGLGYGALNATQRDHFRAPFLPQLREFGHFVPFPDSGPSTLATVEVLIRSAFRRKPIGGILVEPVQARGGLRVPPRGFLPLLRRLCDEHGALLIVDEIYTGFGRTGKWFACEHSAVVPDIICLGKALTGGFPLSACVGRAELMDRAWPLSDGEAVHTSTFLGHPVGCAMALAQIRELQTRRLPNHSRSLGLFLLRALRRLNAPPGYRMAIRGLGLMAGVELRRRDGCPATAEVLQIVKRLLHRGYVFLPEGGSSEVIGFTPPLIISRIQLARAVRALQVELARLGQP